MNLLSQSIATSANERFQNTPNLQIQNQPQQRPKKDILFLGETLTLKINSKDFDPPNKKIQKNYWSLYKGSKHSKYLFVKTTYSDTFSYLPQELGGYILLLISQDEDNNCYETSIPYTVTKNPTFKENTVPHPDLFPYKEESYYLHLTHLFELNMTEAWKTQPRREC